MQILDDIMNFLKTLSFVDVIFFFAVLALMLLIIVLIYFIRENQYEEEINNLTPGNNLPPKTNNNSDEIASLKEITEALENAEPSAINLNKYEEDQEEKAIISYDELLKKKNDFAINYSEEEALDEDLIGINTLQEKSELLNYIHPHYIVLKPSLHGGMHGGEEWIRLAKQKNIGYWITSALESNVGLNAIAQWTAHIHKNPITFPQGLGTGQLFTDNIPSPLYIQKNTLWYKKDMTNFRNR